MNSVNVFSGIRKTVKMPFKIPKFEGISDVLRKAERQQNFVIIMLRLAILINFLVISYLLPIQKK